MVPPPGGGTAPPGGYGRRYPGTGEAGGIIREAFAASNGRRIRIYGILGVFMLLAMALQLLSIIPVLGAIAVFILQGAIMLGYWRCMLNFYDTEGAEYGLLTSGFQQVWKALVVNLFSALPIFAVMLPIGLLMALLIPGLATTQPGSPPHISGALIVAILAAIPFMVVAMGFQVGFMCAYGFLADNPELSIGDACGAAWRISKNNVGTLMVYLLLMILWGIISMVTIIGWIWIWPTLGLSQQILYRGLAEKSGEIV